MLQQINTENFQQMLSQFSTNELEGMIEKFPYFQQAHLLLAKKYQQENNDKFDQQLQLAALYTQDRELLYHLFNNKHEIDSVVTTPIKDIAPVEENVTETAPEKPTEERPLAPEIIATQESVSAVEIKDTSSPESIALALEEIKNSIEAIQQIAEEAKDEETVQVAQDGNIVEEPELKEINPAVVKTVTDLPPVSNEVPIVEYEGQIETVQQETFEEPEETEETPLEVFSRIEPHTFDEWLNAFNNKSISSNPEKQPVIAEEPEPDEELTQLFAENITVDYLHGLVKEETNYAKGLERFIEDQIQKHKPPVTRKKQAEHVPEPELITETMAKVYEMQKKYNKAIEAYEALALKFPEKSSLFAARINFLKNIL